MSFLWNVKGGFMKRGIILFFILLLMCGCRVKEVQKKDPLIDAYKVDNVLLEKDQIKKDLNFFLIKYNRHWSQKDKQKFINILYYGEHEFNISNKIVLAIISVESNYDITVAKKNYNKKTHKLKSIDFGLTQQNSRYYKCRYKAAESYLDYYHIKYTDSKFDMGKNIFSCFMLLRDNNEYSDLIHFKDLIASYNVGSTGVKEEYMQKKVDEYYNLFMQELLSI